MRLEQFSSHDNLSTEQRSSRNAAFLHYDIMISKDSDWHSKLSYYVKNDYLIQHDADMLLEYLKRELEIIQEKKEKAILLDGSPESTKERLKWLMLWIGEIPRNRIITRYFARLAIGLLYFAVSAVIITKFNLRSEYLCYLFAFAIAIWAVTAMDYKEEDSNDLWNAGITCLVLFLVGYGALELLRSIF